MRRSDSDTAPVGHGPDQIQTRYAGACDQRGFSLIEVLVAFVLLSMTLAVLLQIFSGGLQNAGTGERYAQAMVLADSKLEMLGGEQPITPGSVSGEEDGLSWQLDIVPFSDPSREASSRLVELFEVTLTVRWQLGSRERALTLNTLKLAASQ